MASSDMDAIADVRRALGTIRKRWRQQTIMEPVVVSDAVDERAQSMAQFAFRFVLGHHLRRQHMAR